MCRRDIDCVLSPFEHFESGVNGFFESFRFLADDVLYDHKIAGSSHREIGLRGDYQTDGLQIGGYIQAVLAIAVRNHLAQVD